MAAARPQYPRSVIRRLVTPLLDAQTWAEPLGELLVKLYLFFLRPAWLKSFLHGTWLGHALHPLLTDVPVGAFTVALLLDLLGVFGFTGLMEGAKWATLLGVLSMLAAAVAGIADYTGTHGRDRRYGTLHQIVMYVSLIAYVVSLLVRYGIIAGTQSLAIGSAIAGYTLLAIGAYIGGEIVFGTGYMVDRHAWESGGTKWAPLDSGEFPENQPSAAKAGAQRLLIVRQGDALFALHNTCAHAGCDLSEGSIVGGKRDQIECPCHGSRFRLRDGHVTRGPATFDQPVYEVRRSEGTIEVRRARKA
jgi:nitrite reductase/ring-hydroxylating ferredoxin subunit/uncharacterized membrane protein